MSLSFYKFASAARHDNIASKSMTTKTKILDNKKDVAKILIEVLGTIRPTSEK